MYIAPAMATTAPAKVFTTVQAPDFYWQYRLDRLIGKKGADLGFKASEYPEAVGSEEQYEAYYLDLTLKGKMGGFDWMAEKEISDAEWLTIYKSIVKWSAETTKKNKPSAATIPASDFDLLKAIYPQVDYRELTMAFSNEEVGASFPYANMKEMIDAAMAGSLAVPGVAKGSVTSIEASEARKKLAALKEKTMTKIDGVYEKCLTFAKNSFPDAEAKSHYQALRTTLGEFPSSKSGWDTYRSSMEKEVDEMATLASRKEEEHHHGEEEEEGHSPKMSVAEEFQQKYGRNLEEMAEKMSAFKQDPEGFLENSIIQKYGKAGLDIWKKSQEFSQSMSVMSEADKAAAESSFSTFLKSA
jgi:hypothetical protein